MEDAVIDDDWAPAVRSDLTTESIDGELLIFDPSTSQIHQLDPVGTIIWQLLDGEVSLGELVLDLCDAFEVPAGRVRHDVTALLQLLTDHNLLEGQQPERIEQPPPKATMGPTYLVDPPAP